MAAASEEGPGPPRDTEGMVLGLYHYLWLKNHNGESCSVNIPHTIIFQNSQPIAWYFTSLKAGKILRKNKNSIKGEAMAEAFVAGKSSGLEVCAWCSGHMSQLESSARKSRPREAEGRELDVEELAIEYLSQERVKDLLSPGPQRSGAEQMYDGMMQRFVEPRDSCDMVIRAMWSPTSSVLEKRINRHRLDSPDGVPLSDRIASSSAGPWHHKLLPVVEGVLQSRLEAQCAAVAAHVKDVTQGQSLIRQMELIFKIDAHNRIWLLFCSSMQLEKAAPLRVVYHREVHGASFILKDPLQSEEVPAAGSEPGTFICAMTGKTLPIDQRVNVTYRTIMQHWFKSCAASGSDSTRLQGVDCIPLAIRRANPNMSRDLYLRSRSQPFFLLSVADVSQEAAEELRGATSADLADSLSRPMSSRTFPALRPSSASALLPSKPPLAPSSSEPPPSPSLQPGPPGGSTLDTKARPASCSALSSRRQRQAAGPPAQEHWHQRVVGKPTGAAGAVVTPLTTGRVLSTSPTLNGCRLEQQEQRRQQRQQRQAAPAAAWTSDPATPSMLTPKAVEGYEPLRMHVIKALSNGGQLEYDQHTGLQLPPRPKARPGAQTQTLPTSAGSDRSLVLARSEEAGTRGAGASAGASSRRSPRQGPDGSRGGAQQQRRSSLQSGPPARVFDTGRASVEAQAGGLGDTTTTTGSAGGSSRRSQSLNRMSGDERRTLRELSDAYSEAEQLTAALLRQANQLLRAPSSAGGSGPEEGQGPRGAGGAAGAWGQALRLSLTASSAGEGSGSFNTSVQLSVSGAPSTQDQDQDQGQRFSAVGAVPPPQYPRRSAPLVGAGGSYVSQEMEDAGDPGALAHAGYGGYAGVAPRALLDRLGCGSSRQAAAAQLLRGAATGSQGHGRGGSLEALMSQAAESPAATALTAEEEELLSEAMAEALL